MGEVQSELRDLHPPNKAISQRMPETQKYPSFKHIWASPISSRRIYQVACTLAFAIKTGGLLDVLPQWIRCVTMRVSFICRVNNNKAPNGYLCVFAPLATHSRHTACVEERIYQSCDYPPEDRCLPVKSNPQLFGLFLEPALMITADEGGNATSIPIQKMCTLFDTECSHLCYSRTMRQ